MSAEFVVNAFLDEEENRVVLLRRDSAGNLCERSVPTEWASFHRTGQITPELRRMLSTAQSVKSIRDEGEWTRVIWRGKWERRGACFGRVDRERGGYQPSPFTAHGVDHLEADVDPVRRFLTDNDIDLQTPRRCYIDFETDSRVPFSRKESARVLCWSLTDDDGVEVVEVLAADTDAAERDLMSKLWHVLRDYDQVLAWNGDRFDFPVHFARTVLLGLKIDVRRWHWLDHLVVFKRMNMHSAESGDEKSSFALGSIAQALLGETKDDFDASKTWAAWCNAVDCGGGEASCRACRGCLARYNLKDSILLTRIEQKTGYITLFGTLAEVCRVMPDSKGLQPTRQMDGFMLRLAREQKIHFPSKEYQNQDDNKDKFDGAYVMDPKRKGILTDVHVCDFASLYPSIILTWNMSPETKFGTPYLNKTKRTRLADAPDPTFPVCVSPLTGQRFRTDTKGILPYALETMIAMRKYWNDRKASLPPGTPEWYDADRRSTAYKVAANSFYGVVGSPYSRFYDPDIAEACTQAGKWLLVNVVLEAAEKIGMEAIYGDTDSGFIAGTDVESFKAFTKACNDNILPEAIRSVGCVRNDIKLAYEKAFRVLVFVSAKRYIGYYLHYKGKAANADSKPEVKGLEFKRGDSNMIARRLQERVINMLGTSTLTPIVDYRDELRRTMEHVMSSVLDYDQVVMSKNLSRELNGYITKKKKDGADAGVPHHVTIGRILEARGLEVGEGTRVEYVVVDGSSTPAKVIPGMDYAGECDRWYLWESLVYPPTQRLLESAFPEHNWVANLASIRPAKPKGRTRVLEGQLGLDLTRTAPGQVPYVITVDEAIRGYVAELGAVFKRHPGMRPVQIRLRLRSGAVAVLDVPLHVSETKNLKSDLERTLWGIVFRDNVLSNFAEAVSKSA